MKFSLQWLDHRPAPVGSRFTAPATLRVAIRAGRDFPWRISPQKEATRAVAMKSRPYQRCTRIPDVPSLPPAKLIKLRDVLERIHLFLLPCGISFQIPCHKFFSTLG